MKNRPQNHRPPATQATKRPVVLCFQLFFVNSRRRISNHFLVELQQKIKEKNSQMKPEIILLPGNLLPGCAILKFFSERS